ncbi:NHLP bacteriocin system secretion protein [Synechococcus lacustris]|uniref:NHLP bacteriocin system secretion protein n=1 Tax=Synechococcus lacustris TaxID=2116544 RepID=UPI0020CE4FC5|nr:NHLP bacteriocin system secretion protein [Synechococcus lacustris]
MVIPGKLQVKWPAFLVFDAPGYRPVALSLTGMAALTAAWVLLWPVPTEVVGRGVLTVPGDATLLDARAAGQILDLFMEQGQLVRRGQPLLRIYLPALEQELQRQNRDLAELIAINANLNRRDSSRLRAAQNLKNTALVKLQSDAVNLRQLKTTYDQKLADYRYLAAREVVAPLAAPVVSTEDRSTQLAVNIADLRIQERAAQDQYQKIKLEIDSEQQQRDYRINDLRRTIRVTQQRLAFEGTLKANRDGRVLDVQVVRGQTVKAGQRLGTLQGLRPLPLRAVAYFSPADARRLRRGLPLELVPDWQQRGRFGGVEAEVERVNLLPATEEDVNTTLGNPQLARELVKDGPVMRAELLLSRNPATKDGYRWTLSAGSRVFPLREGLTLTAHSYVEWRPPISYLVPVLRNLTGSYRTLRQLRWDRSNLRQNPEEL